MAETVVYPCFHVTSSINLNIREFRKYQKLYCPNSETNKVSWCYSLSVNCWAIISISNSPKQTKKMQLSNLKVRLQMAMKIGELIQIADNFIKFVEAFPENSVVNSNNKF